MNQGRRLLFYIALNIFVSACTTLAILWIWNRPQAPLLTFFPTAQPATIAPNEANAASPANPTAGAATAQPTTAAPINASSAATLPPAETRAATLPPSDSAAKQIVIDNVFGVSNLKDEYVLIKHNGDGELNLTNWHLDDGNGNTYKFPTLTLFKNGAVQIHTAAGVDSVVDLYWGRSEAVWQVGKIITLYDDQNQVRASYRIP